MTDDLPHFSLLTFKTKQNVSKSKLGGKFAIKGWNNFSSGFSKKVQETSFTKREEPFKKKSKIDPEAFKKRILSEKYQRKQKTPIIECKEADFCISKAKDFCSLIQKKSLQGKNQEIKTHNFNGSPKSVFLEVQNIQDSFQQNKSKPNFGFKSLNKNLLCDFPTKRAVGQENVFSKSGCQFFFQENDFSHSVCVKKVQKTNLFSSLLKKNFIVVNNLPESIKNSSFSKKDHHPIKYNDEGNCDVNTRKVPWLDQNQNKNVTFNLSAILENECSKNKGSTWLQSLHVSDTEVVQEDAFGKKRIRNIQPGGFTEQLLKLQRIEKSEEVIWNYKVDWNNKKGKYLALVLISVRNTGGIVIANCQSLPKESSENQTEKLKPDGEEFNGIFTESGQIFVLLKKSVFSKLQLKVHSVFHLYPPWQILFLPRTSCPVILCAKFIDLSLRDVPLNEGNILYCDPITLPSTSASVQTFNSFDEIFYQWEQPISFSGRIQRIWKFERTEKNMFPLLSLQNYVRYSMLIQDKRGIFYELVLSSTHFSTKLWKEFISEAEGKCYMFLHLHLIRRFYLKEQSQLFRVLNVLFASQNDENGFKQKFCYQLVFQNSTVIPEEVSDEGFPVYCPVSPRPLASLFRDLNSQRFTCIGKIIFQFKNTLYLCDESAVKYVRLESLFPVESKYPLVGSLVLIKEALLLEGCLFLDNYSLFYQISEESKIDERLKSLLGNRLNQLTKVTWENVIPSIDVTTENSTFVLIKGEVISVDENNALSWLQCNLCFSDNLVQDSQQVIYCDNCFQVVPKPVLNVKMSVTCQCSSNVKVEIELLSRTIKRILQINDNTYQPQCNTGDVLRKQVGPLLCFIRSSVNVGDEKQFHSSEVDTS